MNRLAFHDQLAGFFMILEAVLFKSSLDLILLWTSIFCPIRYCIKRTAGIYDQLLAAGTDQI